MQIVGRQVNSFIDFPGKIAYVVFTAGCNMDCWYCHNKIAMKSKTFIPEDEILEDISARVGFIDGVVVTGGEPTLQRDLPKFLRAVKGLGLLTKLDTNGTDPATVKKLINQKLVDFIAMDIKAPLWKYPQITLVDSDTDKIEKSIELIKKNAADYEFRTTFAPDLTAEDIGEIAQLLSGAKRYTLQNYKKSDGQTSHPKINFLPHSQEYAKVALKLANKYTKTNLR